MTKPSFPAEPYGHIHIGGSLYKQAQASINGSGTRNPLWLQPYGYLAKRRPSARHTYQAKQSWQISSLPVLYYKKWNDIPTLPKYVLYRTRRCGLILPFIINQIKRACTGIFTCLRFATAWPYKRLFDPSWLQTRHCAAPPRYIPISPFTIQELSLVGKCIVIDYNKATIDP